MIFLESVVIEFSGDVNKDASWDLQPENNTPKAKKQKIKLKVILLTFNYSPIFSLVL